MLTKTVLLSVAWKQVSWHDTDTWSDCIIARRRRHETGLCSGQQRRLSAIDAGFICLVFLHVSGRVYTQEGMVNRHKRSTNTAEGRLQQDIE